MKIFLFTNFTPTIDNYRGPSAMMYHFFNGRPNDCEVLVFTTNSNCVPVSTIKEIENKQK